MDQFNVPSYPPVAIPTALPARKRSLLRWALASLAVLAALLAGLFTLWMIGYETGLVPLLAGLVAATIPVPIYVTLVLWLDRYEPEPPWMLATAFFWCALVAVFFALIINSLGVALVGYVWNEPTANFYGMVISAPVVEETSKALDHF